MFTVQQLTSEAEYAGLIALRWRVLRPGLPESTAYFGEDKLPGTIHIIAVSESDQTVVGCGTLVENAGLQLRGMATDPEWRGKGVGAAILAAIQEIAREREQTLWCNARVSALGFYEKCGWKTEGDEFDVPTVGPHYIMRWQAAYSK